MPAEHDHPLGHDLRRLGTRLLAENEPVTLDEIVGRAAPSVVGEPLMNGHRVTARFDAPVGAGSRHGKRPAVLIGAAAAASLLTAGLVFANRSGAEPDSQVGSAAVVTGEPASTAPASTAAPVALNQSFDEMSWPPRLLLDESWEIVSANEPSINEGAMTFRRDDVLVSIGWYRGDAAPLDKQLEGTTEIGTTTLLGEPTTVYGAALAYEAADIRELVDQGVIDDPIVVDEFGPTDTAAGGVSSDPTLPPALDSGMVGGPMLDEALADAVAAGQIEAVPSWGPSTFLQWSGSSISVSMHFSEDAGGPASDAYDADEFAAIVESIGHVDQATWEAAMPDRVVTPDERQQVVDELLAGVPIPDSWGPGYLGQATLVRDRLDLAAELQQSAACAWLTRHFAGQGPIAPADSTAPAIDPLDAIASIPEWPMSQELAEYYADPLAFEGLVARGNTSVGAITVTDDGTLFYEPRGEELDEFFAAQLCDRNAVG